MNILDDVKCVGWDEIIFDEPELSYEFNMLCFWKTKNGLILSGSDSGCSCPSPFERYDGKSEKELEQTFERVGSFKQAKQIIDSWNEDIYTDTKTKISQCELDEKLNKLKGWFRKK